MKINWKVRLKNPVFWATITPAVVSLVYTILGAFNIAPDIASNEVVTYLGMLISALSTLGVLVDPTTSGLSDSSRALLYTEPQDSELYTNLQLQESDLDG